MTHRRPARVALAALLVAHTAACAAIEAGAAPRPAELLSDSPREPERTCRVAGEPKALPSANAVVDSAGLARDVAAVWRASGQPAGHALLALRYDRYGINVRRDVIEHRLNDALADTVQKLVFAHRRTVAEADREWSLRLRVDMAEEPRIRVGRSEVCQPMPRERSAPMMGNAGSRAWYDTRDPMPPAGLMDEGTVWVRVALDESGLVTAARVERGATRAPSQTSLLTYLRAIVFFPATEDGYPVPGEASIPLRLR